MTIYIGIDPGLSGGIAAIDQQAKPLLTSKMPPTERELWTLISDIAESGDCMAVLEKLGGAPRIQRAVHCKRCGGVTSTSAPLQTPANMLTMGTNYGLLRMALTAALIPFDEASPRKWQQVFGLVFTSGDNLTATQKKNRHKQQAEHLFPGAKVTHAVADSLLLAEFCRRTMSPQKVMGADK